MDPNIITSLLSVVVSTLSEIRKHNYQRKKESEKALGIGLLNVLLALDKIILTGKEIIQAFAGIELARPTKKADSRVKSKLSEIDSLLLQQKQNIEYYFATLKCPVRGLNSTVHTIANVIGIKNIDDGVHYVTSKEVLVGEGLVLNSNLTSRLLGKDNKESRRWDQQAKIKADNVNTESDFSRISNIRKYISRANKQLDEIVRYRNILKAEIMTSFTLEQLISD